MYFHTFWAEATTFVLLWWLYTMNVPNGHVQPPAIYFGELILPPNVIPANTFINPTGWGKGVVFVNNHNLGRYWPSIGSQVTLFVPGSYLKAAPERNHIVIVETEYAHAELKIHFTDEPYLNKTPPKNTFL